ncbi:MAG: tail fiber domain-containing protein [Anaerolineae bacterium]|jgi:hypothetical protein|nr:tail fiber domain-containing protein [Anaerolineae bacterium]
MYHQSLQPYLQKSGKKWLAPLTLLLAMLLIGQGAMLPVQAQSGGGTIAEVQLNPAEIIWQPQVTYDTLILTITGPDDLVVRQEFPTGTAPTFKPTPADQKPYPDGPYTYELHSVPVIDAETRALLEAAREAGESDALVAELQQAGKLPQTLPAQVGYFTVLDGAVVIPSGSQDEDEVQITPLDFVPGDDVIVHNSLCVGFDCVNGEDFDFDTIRLKENNLQIAFDDTSTTGSFPANDWKIQINDTANGGISYFSVWDVTHSRRPFLIEANAPTNSLYVDDYGRVGLGTATPVLEVHIVDSDTPSVRLDQDGSGGWTPQIWDISGNESNFFIRDATNGSNLPFRIQPGAPSSSLTLKANGNVGVGTWSPAYPLELETTGKDAILAAQRTDGATAQVAALADSVQIGSITNHGVDFVVNDETVMALDAGGNLTLDGALIESSDVNIKENFAPVDGQEILACLAEMPITTWNYSADDDAVRHMGPMAQDFYAAFGLGADERHIAPLDANGVALVALQELNRTVEVQDVHIADLEQQNADLEARVAALEALVAAMLQQAE